MAKGRKKNVSRRAPKASALPTPTLAPQVLEEAAQGWLQSAGSATPAPRLNRPTSDDRLAEVLTETLRQLRTEISELRSRLDRIEQR